MDNVISEYQRWKKQGEQLRDQARQAMESRYQDLLNEAAQIAQEYRNDFGAIVKLPPNITAFRFKTGARRKARKQARQPPGKPQEPPSDKVIALQKQRAQLQKKLEVAKTTGKPTKNLDDRLYEIEDELRLAGAL